MFSILLSPSLLSILQVSDSDVHKVKQNVSTKWIHCIVLILTATSASQCKKLWFSPTVPDYFHSVNPDFSLQTDTRYLPVGLCPSLCLEEDC